MQFSDKIIEWYEQNKRSLPWRETTDPYAIWMSEIILQQTKVNQGIDYYYKFLEAFPTVHNLANATEEKVLKLWQGLGYYNRARNLHFTAKEISAEHQGKFPNSFEELKKLKGVGDYTAAAIASFCFNEVIPVVDGNVYRVLSRYFADDTPINTGLGQKQFFNYASELISKQNPDIFNQAIMEFGALQCTAKSPDCNSCPLKDSCMAFAKKEVLNYPVKKGKTLVSPLYIKFFVLEKEDKIGFKQRESKGIWANLYDFPSIESSEDIAFEETIKYFSQNYSHQESDQPIIKNRTVLKHKLSHKNIEAEFIEIDMKSHLLKDLETPLEFQNPNNLKVGIPRLIELYLEKTKRI